MTKRTRSTLPPAATGGTRTGAEWNHAPFQPSPPARLRAIRIRQGRDRQSNQARCEGRSRAGTGPGACAHRRRAPGECTRRRVVGPVHHRRPRREDLHLSRLLHGGAARCGTPRGVVRGPPLRGGRGTRRAAALAHQLLDLTQLPLPLTRPPVGVAKLDA